MKILVRNLAITTSNEKLKSLFDVYGKVQSCHLVLDKETEKSKGFAFIEMPKVGEAKVAIQKLNGYKLAGNIIRVKKAETKKETLASTNDTVSPAQTKVLNTHISPSRQETKVASPTELPINKNNALNIYGTIKR